LALAMPGVGTWCAVGWYAGKSGDEMANRRGPGTRTIRSTGAVYLILTWEGCEQVSEAVEAHYEVVGVGIGSPGKLSIIDDVTLTLPQPPIEAVGIGLFNSDGALVAAWPITSAQRVEDSDSLRLPGGTSV
jgi:hypothetical protein